MTNVPSNLLDLLSGVLFFPHSSLGKPMDPSWINAFIHRKLKTQDYKGNQQLKYSYHFKICDRQYVCFLIDTLNKM